MEVISEEQGQSASREATIFAVHKTAFSGFLDFVRERGVAGLAIGFVFGTSVQKLISAFVTDIITPLITMVSGSADSLGKLAIGPFLIGDFLSNFIDFTVLILVVYLFFKGFRLDKLDKPKG